MASQKRIPRTGTNPKSVRIETPEGKKTIKIPSDVPIDRVDKFQKYAQYKWDYEHSERKFAASNGKVYPLPAMNKKLILKILSGDEERQAFIDADMDVRKRTSTLMHLKNAVFGDVYTKDAQSLFDEYSGEILDWLGRGYSASEVHAILLKKGVSIKYPTIIDFHKKNREKVSELRNEYNNNIQDVSLSSKRSRLEKLNYLYHEIDADFEKTNTPLLRSNLSKELRGIIEQAKKEVEGENLKLTVDGNIDINASLTALMANNRMMYGLTIPQMVIARVAARLKLPSQYFIDRLARSYYAKYNGYRSNDDLTTKPIYPTSVQYDILSEEMGLKNKLWEEKNRELMKIEDVPDVPDEQENMAERRDEIKKRLRQMLNVSESKN